MKLMGWSMNEEQEKIVLPKELQKDMLQFFLRTSIPRKLKQERQKQQQQNEAENSQSENKNRLE